MERPITQREVSAGGIVYRLTGGEPEVVLVRVRRAGHDRWVLPKGLVGEGETLEEAARREVEEETGVAATVEGALPPVELWYYWPPGQRRRRVHKTVHYFLMRFAGGDTAQHDREVEEARWFPLSRAIAEATFPNDRRLLGQARLRLA
ncbi:MAG: NUDIX domain-containing protein, partial [Anaerolineae bacterium]|nr:NUDIX domain-containing protein [Anaerolineae bacterium]